MWRSAVGLRAGGFSKWRLEHGTTLDQASALDALFAGEGRLFGDVAALKTKARWSVERSELAGEGGAVLRRQQHGLIDSTASLAGGPFAPRRAAGPS